jgi:predicted small metal-binding protein
VAANGSRIIRERTTQAPAHLDRRRITNAADQVASTVPPWKDIVMKTMTCEQLGGTCDRQLSAESWDGMVQTMTRHVMKKHPDVARKMKKMHEQDPTKWGGK